jgi:transposase
VGWLTVRRRRLTACGVQPGGSVQPVFAWFSVDGAVAPTTGEHFFLELPYVNAPTFPLFVDAFAAAFPDSVNLLRSDNSGAHPAPPMRWPAHVRGVWRPPYGPELNPLERVWRDLKDDRAWQQFTHVEAPQEHVGQLLQADEASTRQSLTSYTYVVEAINALAS